MDKNIILTCSDDDYFDSFLKLLTSLNKTNIYKVILLNLGLSYDNMNLAKKIDLVHLINFEKEFQELDDEMGCDYFKNKKTYGFKSYLLKNFDLKFKILEEYNYNILCIDSGIHCNKSLDRIFEIIHNEEIFCVDHSSEMPYGNIEKSSRWADKYGDCMLLNILPPPMYELLKKEYPINIEGLTKQYIKAGLFGYKYKGKYQHIADDVLNLTILTYIGLFPMTAVEERKAGLREEIKNKYNIDKLYTNYKNISFYNKLVKTYLNDSNIKYYTTNWNSHRHDQTVLSYLINRLEIPIYNSDKYITTLYQKTHFVKYIFFQSLYLLKRREEIQDLEPVEEKKYNLSNMNIGENLDQYFSQQYVQIKCDEYDKDRVYFSSDDIIYSKYRDILKIYEIESDGFTDILYYNLMINWERQKDKIYKKILLKTNDKYLILHRSHKQENVAGEIINLISMTNVKNIKLKSNKIVFQNKPKTDTIFIMGNGPSLKEIMDNSNYLMKLKKYDTFGLNAAYRAYDKYDFYPTYFGCFDSKVCKHHSKEFERLILTSPIKKFFFINIDPQGAPIFTDPKIINHPKFININFVLRTQEQKKMNDILSYKYSNFTDMMTSGTNSVQCCLIEGYKKIYLLGCDCNYVEVIEGAEYQNNTIKMIETPSKNVNYWIDDYQQKGDVFNLPNVQGCQLPAWKRLSDILKELKVNVSIFNCSDISKIDYFEKISFSSI